MISDQLTVCEINKPHAFFWIISVLHKPAPKVHYYCIACGYSSSSRLNYIIYKLKTIVGKV